MHNAWRQYMGQLITIPDSNEPQGTSSGVYVTVVLRMIQTVHAPNRLRRDVSDCNEMIIDLTGLSGLQMTGPSHRNCINAAYDKNLGHHHLRRLMHYLDHQCAMCNVHDYVFDLMSASSKLYCIITTISVGTSRKWRRKRIHFFMQCSRAALP